MKKILGTIMCFLIMFSMTACGESAPPLLDENGNWVHYSEEEITSNNYYILKDDGMYYRILDVPVGESSLGTIYSWFCEPYDAAIPHFTSKDRLMFYSDTDRPETLTLYKMTDYAYTLGIMFEVENDAGDLKHPQIIHFTDSFNGQSPVGGVINGVVTPNSTTYVTGINNHEFTSNLLVDDSFLKGLTKDTMYQLEIYCGTVRKTVNVKADTHLFLKEATYTTSSYEELKSKVFEIYLPQNLAPGYYYAEDVGMFYYDGVFDDIDEDDIESMLENQDNGPSEETGDTADTSQSEENIGRLDEDISLDELDGNSTEDTGNIGDTGDAGDSMDEGLGDLGADNGDLSSEPADTEGAEPINPEEGGE